MRPTRVQYNFIFPTIVVTHRAFSHGAPRLQPFYFSEGYFYSPSYIHFRTSLLIEEVISSMHYYARIMLLPSQSGYALDLRRCALIAS